jgi:hypothetical protein
VFISNLVGPIQRALTGSDAYEWLVGKRGLPADIEWLRYRDVGTIPENAPSLRGAEEEARTAFAEARQEAFGNLTAKDDPEVEGKLWEVQAERMEDIFKKADNLLGRGLGQSSSFIAMLTTTQSPSMSATCERRLMATVASSACNPYRAVAGFSARIAAPALTGKAIAL